MGINYLFGIAALSMLIPIIILYMLRPSHQIKEVPSTYLWTLLTEQLTERAKLDKLRRQLLLFLDLLIVIVIALMLMHLVFGLNQQSLRQVILIDGSFSMQAKDASPTRLDAAKQQAKNYMDALSKDTVVTLIHLTDTPKIMLKNETNRWQLKRGVDLLAQSQSYWSYQDLEKAINSLELTDEDHVIYFGDKTVPSFEVIRVDKSQENYSIVKMASEKIADKYAVLASIENSSTENRRVEVSFYDGDLYVETQTKMIPAGEIASVFFKPIKPEHGVLRAEIDTSDILAEDNIYYHLVDVQSRPKIAYFGEGNAFIDKYLALKDCDVTKHNLYTDTLSGYDLYIFDGVLPKELPADGNILSLDPQQNLQALNLTSSGYVEHPNFTRDAHGVNQFLQSESFHIGISQIFDLPAVAKPIFSVPKGALAFSYNRGSQKVMVFGFDFRYTDLPLDIQFPIMMNNIYSEMTTSQITEKQNYSRGEDVVVMPLPQTEKIIVSQPDNSESTLDLKDQKFTQTNQYGVYSVRQLNAKEQVLQSGSFVVNPPVASGVAMFKLNESQDARPFVGGQDITQWLGYVLLALLACETYLRLKK